VGGKNSRVMLKKKAGGRRGPFPLSRNSTVKSTHTPKVRVIPPTKLDLMRQVKIKPFGAEGNKEILCTCFFPAKKKNNLIYTKLFFLRSPALFFMCL